ncbi:MAG: PP2C family protein-serine/threonine phosphatase [Lachnospiraceae bacterium]
MNYITNQIENALDVQTGIGGIIGTREYQQDFAYIYTDKRDVLGILCDGMGGLNGGEAASQTAVSVMAGAFLKERPQHDIPGFFFDTAKKMDKMVAGLTDKNGKALNAGTTALAALIRDGELYIMSVGDSKLYLIREDKIKTLTREHNYRLQLTEQRDAGMISAKKFEEESNTRMAEALISYVGMNGLARTDINRQPFVLQDGDIVLLCSDGLYKAMSEQKIYAMIRDNDFDMELAAARLLDMSKRCAERTQDNTTVILMKYEKEMKGGCSHGQML